MFKMSELEMPENVKVKKILYGEGENLFTILTEDGDIYESSLDYEVPDYPLDVEQKVVDIFLYFDMVIAILEDGSLYIIHGEYKREFSTQILNMNRAVHSVGARGKDILKVVVLSRMTIILLEDHIAQVLHDEKSTYAKKEKKFERLNECGIETTLINENTVVIHGKSILARGKKREVENIIPFGPNRVSVTLSGIRDAVIADDITNLEHCYIHITPDELRPHENRRDHIVESVDLSEYLTQASQPISNRVVGPPQVLSENDGFVSASDEEIEIIETCDDLSAIIRTNGEVEVYSGVNKVSPKFTLGEHATKIHLMMCGFESCCDTIMAIELESNKIVFVDFQKSTKTALCGAKE